MNATPDTETVYVYRALRDVPDDPPGPALAIDEELCDVEESTLDGLSERLINLEPDSPFERPMYGIVSRQLWSNERELLAPEPRNMPLLVVLYRRLAAFVDENDADRVVCVGVGGVYLDVLADLRSNEGVAVEVRDEPSGGTSFARLLLRSGLAVSITFLDLIVSLILGPLLRVDSGADVAVLFPVGRPQVFRPLYGHLDFEFDTLYSSRTVSYLLNYRDLVPSRYPDYPVAAAVDPRGLLLAAAFVGRLYWDLLVGGRQAGALVEAVEESEGVELEGVVSRLYRRSVLINMDSLAFFVVADRLFRGRYERVLVPGMTRKSRALVLAALGNDVEVHHLSHGVGNRRLRFLRIEQTHFTAGEIDQSYIERHNELMRPVVTGLPKHQHILERRHKLEASGESRNSGTVLVATQPWLDRIRESFIRDVLPVLLDETSADVVIKPHPGETVEYYEGLVAALGLGRRSERVTVEKGDLYEMIYRSEYVVTITSNVALESLIMGVPVVSYNPWAPDIETPLFVEFGDVPAFDEVDGFREFVRQPSLGELHEEEDAMLDDDYVVYGNSIDAIASRVGDTIDPSRREGG